jgi:hypothetical protein
MVWTDIKKGLANKKLTMTAIKKHAQLKKHINFAIKVQNMQKYLIFSKDVNVLITACDRHVCIQKAILSFVFESRY